ncbi:5-oxoprolinase subunit PxpA [Paenibacillus sabinae]|uniref:5-oxoprolinase subunit A n=1 Tax=Paenibacillus sabinae T27 TaxID=1268072 RepID=X4ZYD6_9BACL|nr:5-oxoprolinase subunit PxpA [Paenibacillus sabinae]AHV96694.1 LamB/YcsF family protein [Paenibacillus sabinae T27]
MKAYIDICSDLGEGYGNYKVADDQALLEVVSSANIACGFHAGDPRTMNAAVAQAVKMGVGIGAHPGFPDLVGFGRRDMELTPLEIITDTLYQIGALSAFAKAHGGSLQHVFPHGVLGNRVNYDRKYAEAFVEAIVKYDPSLIVMTDPGELANIAEQRGLKIAYSIYADRAYNVDGSLVSRSIEGAVIHEPEVVVERCLRMVLERKVTAITGKEIEVHGHTLVVHGDTAGSLELALKIKETLKNHGIGVMPLGKWL